MADQANGMQGVSVESFQHVMSLISVVIGLGVAHILSALGQAIHRRMGSGAPLKLDATTLLWIGFVFIWLVGFWWFEYRFSEQAVWTMGLYLFLLGYSVLLFMLAIVLVPFQLEGVSSTREHFFKVRPWFYGLLLAVNVVDLGDTFMKGMNWGLRPSYLIFWGATSLVCIIGLVTKKPRVHLFMALVMFLWQLQYTFADIGVLKATTG